MLSLFSDRTQAAASTELVGAQRFRGRRVIAMWCMLGLAVATPALSMANASSWQLYGRFEADVSSEVEPIEATLSKWGREFQAGERQWALARAEVGARYQGWLEVSGFRRGLADIRINREAADLYGRIMADKTLAPEQSVPVVLTANSFVGEGVRLGVRWGFDGLQVTLGLSMYDLDYLLSGALTGEIITDISGQYSFAADIDYAYYKDLIFGREEVRRPKGLGISGDMGFVWQPSQHWRFSIMVEDAFARLQWRDVPFTQTLAPVSLDRRIEDGRLPPVGQWSEGSYSRYRQALEPRYQAHVTLTEGSWSGLLRSTYQFDELAVGFGSGYRPSSRSTIKVLYWPAYTSPGVELSVGQWQLGVMADHYNFSEMQRIKVHVSYGI